jgi:hypothetical protein
MSRYQLPAWADFEFGTSPVLWEPKQPKAGETMTVWYNPELTGLQNGDYVAFNGAPPPLIFPCAPHQWVLASRAPPAGCPPRAARVARLLLTAELSLSLSLSVTSHLSLCPGGFNGPFMCGGAPRGMAFKTRGDGNVPLYSIRINVPKHARYLEFGFTDGFNWDEGYKVSALGRERQKSEREGEPSC